MAEDTDAFKQFYHRPIVDSHSRRLLARCVSRLGAQNVRLGEPRFTAWGTESVNMPETNHLKLTHGLCS